MGKSTKDEIAEVVDELKYGHPETRKKAAIKLGRIRDKTVIPHLIKAMLHDSYKWTRISAIQSLTWIADQRIIEPLIQVAKDDTDDLVRKTAIEALGNFRNEEAISHLEIIVNDRSNSEEIRKAASIAIQVIQGITPSWSQDMNQS